MAETDPREPEPLVLALALSTLFESLLVHLRDRGVLDSDQLDQIYETAIRVHGEIDGEREDHLHARVAAHLSKLQADGDVLGRAG